MHSQSTQRRLSIPGVVFVVFLASTQMGCGDGASDPEPRSKLSQAQAQALEADAKAIEVQAKAAAIVDSDLLKIKATLPLIEEYQRTGDGLVGEKIIEAVPATAKVDATGKRTCCDDEALERAKTAATDSTDAGDKIITGALERIESTLAGHAPSDRVGNTGGTVSTYLQDLHTSLVADQPDLAVRVEALASKLGVSLASSASQTAVPEAAVRRVAAQFYEAFASGDGATTCGLLTDQGQKAVVDLNKRAQANSPDDCESAVENLVAILGRKDLDAFAMEAKSATVDVLPRDARMKIGDSGLTFRRIDAGWLIDLPAAIVRD